MLGAPLRTRLAREVDGASLYAFRVMFGSLMAVSSARFMASGWVDRMFGERTFYFKYWGFSWVEPLSVPGMYGVYSALTVLGLAIALGLFYRVAIVLFFVLFSYAELTDLTNYLNHYYLVSLLALLMASLPLSGGFSLDARLGIVARRNTLPAHAPWLFRFQVTLVYVFAALAKCGSDWLHYAWPLNTWLGTQVDLPVVGPSLAQPGVALVLSWCGLLHDLLVPALLLWRRTRLYAYAALVAFHLMTSTWFNIGIFPVLMPMAASVFFDSDWPRSLLARFGKAVPSASTHPEVRPLPRVGLVLLGSYCALQLLVPLRAVFYGGNVLWHEQGMRFSWRVMVRDKRGSVMFRAELPNGHVLRVSPRRYLSSEQEREMASQPDMILQLAHHLAADYAERGTPLRAVYADVQVSLNGRTPQPMIDPRVDLLKVKDGLGQARYVLAGPTEPPPALRAPQRPAELKR